MFSKKISLFILPFVAMRTLQANDPLFDDPFRDDIFKEMHQIQKDMDKIFERMHQRMEERTKHWSYPGRQSMIPSSRMQGQSVLVDKGSYYEYNTQIPEGKNNQIDISIEDGILHFKAKVDRVSNTKQSDMKVQQHYVSMVKRSETLPQDADPSSLKSGYQNGIFVLTLQKKKRLTHPMVKEKERKLSTPAQQISKPESSKKEENQETNTTKIKVPHTSSHV